MNMLTAIKRWPYHAGLIVALLLTVLVAVLFRTHATAPIDSFAACATAGYPITDSNPPVCRVGSYYLTGPVTTPGATAQPQTNNDFSLLASADGKSDLPRQEVVIRTPDDYASWWDKVHAGVTMPPILPVDFKTNDVVILIEGPQKTTGYVYKVTGVSSTPNGTTIDSAESVPTIGCPVQNTGTNRYFIAKTPKLPVSVIFRNTLDYRHCQ